MDFAHRLDEFALLIENEKGARFARMSYVDETRPVDGNAMRGIAISVVLGEFSPSMLHGVLKFPFAEHKGLFRFGGQEVRRCKSNRSN